MYHDTFAQRQFIDFIPFLLLYLFLNSSGSEATFTSECRIQILNLNNLRHHDLLDYHLCNPVTNFYFKISVLMVEQYHPYGTPAIRVDHARSHIDRVLP